MPPKAAQQPPLTQLAEVYSHRQGKATCRRANELKSGLTPSYLPDKPNQRQRTSHRNLEKHQRSRFHGFTAAELRNLESLAPYYDNDKDAFHSDFPQLNAIHPVFERSRWTQPLPKHMAFFPLGNGRDGFWDARKDLVWNALKPGIRIASQTLLNADTWPWWEVLITGIYTKIPKTDFSVSHRQKTFYQFEPRVASARRSDKFDHQEKFAALAKNIEFHLMSEYVSPESGLEREWTVNAETESQREGPTITWFSFELLAPLLDGRISVAERMLCHFRVAVTLLHEFAHAIWNEIVKYDEQEGPEDPYFGDELWAEVGFSMEMAVFGALTAGHEFNDPSRAPIRGLPNAGFFQYGVKVLHVGPKIVGVKDTGSANTVSPLSDGIEDEMSNIDMLEVRTSAAERLFVTNENARRIRSKQILEAWK
ncbi:hypothetical protein EG329_013609 [Mollisiaceae sp. DMI_Dod_QoI]|nr:hypothetical protein EG329_013609 [Helotiales sp. DMI_Dod_QoI]